MNSFEKKTKRTTFFIAGFLIITAFILSTGYLYYRYAVKSFRVQIDQELSAIADLKVKEIIEWRRERLGDVSVFYKNDLFSSLVQRYFEKPDDAETLKRIQNWLGYVHKYYDYDKVFLMDANGIERFTIPKATTPIASVISLQHFEVMKSKQIIFVDFYRNEHDNEIYLSVLTPIIDAQDSSRVLGILGLQIDPEHYIYPLISSWPTPSKTSETLILRREGNEVVFLNELKFQKNTALNLRMPMNGTNAIPAIKAALGEEGIVEALDYRGVPVIAEIRTIHGSPWFMVARMDQAEAFAPIRERLLILLIFFCLFIVGICVVVVLLWRNQNLRFQVEKEESLQKLNAELETRVKERTEALIYSEEQYRLMIEGVRDYAILMLDQDGIITNWNVGGERIKGYKSDEIIGKHFSLFYPKEDIEKGKPGMELDKAVSDGRFEDEGWRVRKDGTQFWANVVITSILNKTGELIGFSKITSDITKRKQEENKNLRQREILESITKDIPLPKILELIVKSVEEEDTSSLCSILLLDSEGKHLLNGASPSLPEFYNQAIHGIEIGEKVGSCGAAAWSKKRVIAEDLLIHPNWAPYTELTQRANLRSCWSEPILNAEEKVLGTFAIYHHEPRVPLNEEIELLKSVVYLASLAITRKQDEEKIHNLNEELEIKVDKRTKQLSEANEILSVEILEKTRLTHMLEVNHIELQAQNEQIQESERKFRQLFDAIPDAIFIHNLEGHFLQVNKAACERLGYSNEELLKMTVKDIDTAEFAEKYDGSIKSFIEIGQGVLETEHIRQDGSIILTELSSCIIEFAGKTAVLSVARDITQRKQKEEQLNIQSTALNAAANAIVITNISGQIEWANPAFTKLTGYTLEEITGENPRTIKSGKHDAAFYKNLWDTIIAGKVWQGEMINKRKDESEYTEEMTITPLKDVNGEIIRFIAIKQDITERKHAEEEIHKLQQQIDYIFGATKTGLHIVDIDFNLNYVSPSLQSIYGNYTDRKCYEYFKGFSKVCDECLVKQAFETRSSVQYETTFPFENNRPVQAKTIPFKDKDGRWLAAEVTVDITERKKFEEELSIAKTEAERANLTKSEFLSRMSHELRTPMNSILGFAQLMDMGELKPAQKKGVGHILKSGKHLLDLINEVLELSRIEAGKLSISLEQVQLRGIILETMDVLRPLATERNLSLNLSDSPVNDLFAEADRQRLKQVLLNLTSNAVKYNRDGGSVHVECELLHPENEPMVRISITDTGNGISPEGVTKLFTPFERIDADKTETEGTGLGLAIAKKMIEAMDGKIGVESEVGIGSTFWIELPLIEGQPDLSERLTEQVVPEQEKAQVSGTILYIEDNISNIQLVEQILEEHRPSFRLNTEMYGKNAVKCATDYAPDLILLDLDLPDIHGSEVLKLLQAKSKTSAIPVVILSADATGHSVEQLMKAGAKDYLTKPLDVLEFLRVVDEVMGKKH